MKESQAAETAPAPEGVTLADIAKLIQDMSGRLDRVEQAQTEQANAIPTYVTMEAPEDPKAERRRLFEETHPDEVNLRHLEGQDTKQLPLSARKGRGQQGQYVQGRPRFGPQQPVRIRPAAIREGFPQKGDLFPEKYTVDSRGHRTLNGDWQRWHKLFPEATETFPRDVTWADVLQMARSKGEGKVLHVAYFSGVNQWKYKVVVPGITRKIGDGFLEYELEAV